MPSPVTDILWHVNSEVAKLSRVSLSRVMEVLDAAEVELTKDLALWKLLGKGDARFTPQMYRNALIQIRSTLRHIRGPVAEGMASALRHGGQVAGTLATAHLVYELEAFSSLFEHSIRPIAFEATAVIADGKKLLWPTFKNSAARYAGQVGEDIRKQLAIGLVRGETIDQLTNRLARLGGPKGLVYTRGRAGSPNAKAEVIAEGLFRRYRHWGERLAVTETVSAYNTFALTGIEELEENDPGYYRRWDAAIDKRTCPLCARYDDLVVPVDKKFPGGLDHPPLHPRCFPADTQIQGFIKGALKTWYSGKMIKMRTQNGRTLSATPNHPILTERGFVAIGDLRKGDKLICHRRSIEDSLFSPGIIGVEKYNPPTTASDLFSTLRKSGQRFITSPSMTDLHGDAKGVYGNIEIVKFTREFQITPQPPGLKFFNQFDSMQANVLSAVESSLGSLSFGLRSMYSSFCSDMCCRYLPFNSIWPPSFDGSPLDYLLLGSAAQGDPVCREVMGEDFAPDSKFFGKLVDRRSGLVEIDQVLDILEYDFSGHVYDFETLPGWTIAQDIYTSNCRCAVVLWRKEWKESKFKDDLVKESVGGVEPKGVASVPHVIKVRGKAKPPKPAI